MDIYVGIDPSINSTGVVIQYSEKYEPKFFILKPNKLTAKEKKADNELDKFKYVIYEKFDLKDYKEKNYIEEYYKTLNLIHIVNAIDNMILAAAEECEADNIYIVQEGISYGSTLRTKSVFDLAGLNFLIRSRFIMNDNKCIKFWIGTPGEIKKFATGKGNANKDLMKTCFAAIHSEMMVVPKYDDLADAFFMSEYAKKICKDII